MLRPLECLDAYAQRYGDPFTLGRSTEHPSVYFSNPAAIQQILSADTDCFDPRRRGVVPFLLGEHSLVYLQGQEHRRRRQLLSPPLHGERLRTFGDFIRATAERVTDAWTPGRAFGVRQSLQEVTLGVISGAIFGFDGGPRVEQLRQRFGSLLDSVTSPLTTMILTWGPQQDWGPLSPWGRMLRRKQRIDQLITDEIEHRRTNGGAPGSDILSLLMLARDRDGEALTEDELRDQVVTFLFAGHENTASALSWALYWIHRLPEVHEKIRREIDQLGERATPLEVARLPYLSALCEEVLRIYPGVLTVTRIPNAPFSVMSHRFEAGTALVCCVYLTHRRADLYPEPERFRPERFLERQYSAFEYLPFGAGPRRCLGMAFAEFEMKVVLATILSRWELTLPDRRLLKPVRREALTGPPRSLELLAVRRR